MHWDLRGTLLISNEQKTQEAVGYTLPHTLFAGGRLAPGTVASLALCSECSKEHKHGWKSVVGGIMAP